MDSRFRWSVVDSIYKGYWWQNRGILMLNICLLIPMMTSVANGIDSSNINGLQMLPDWQKQFGHPRETMLGLVSSAQFLGNLTALPMTPFASDFYGRRAALLFGCIVMLLGVGLQTAASSVGMLFGARYCIGFGLSFCQNAAPLLLIELSYPTQRGKITAMFNSCWYLGSIISAWVCYGAYGDYVRANGTILSWRIPTIVQAFIPAIQIVSLWFIPESPRWLVYKGMEGKAAAILAKYHANGHDEQDPLVVYEMAQIRHAIRKEEEINKSTSYWSLFTSPGHRKRMCIILAIGVFSQCSGNGLVSYYLNLVLEGVGITETETKTVINGCLQIFNFIVALGAAMLVDFVGRRPLFIISNSGMLAIFSCWTITIYFYDTIRDSRAAQATVPLIFLFFIFYDLAYAPMLVAYTLEILPFRVRAKGFAVMNFVTIATVAFNQIVNAWAITIGWRYYLVYCVWLVIELLFVIFFIVETKGRTLEETAASFDGEGQPSNFIATGSKAAAKSAMMVKQVTTSLTHHSVRQEQSIAEGDHYKMTIQCSNSDLECQSRMDHASMQAFNPSLVPI